MYFNGERQQALYALLRCTAEHSEVLARELKLSKSAAFLPFTIIKLFLKRERKNRLHEVDDAVEHFSVALGRVTIPRTEHAKFDTGQLIGICLNVNTLKSGLLASEAKLERIAQWTELSTIPDGDENCDIDLKVYLQHLIDEYHIRINDCETVLQGTSLAFQLVRVRPPPQSCRGPRVAHLLGNCATSARGDKDCHQRREGDEDHRSGDDVLSPGNFLHRELN